MRVSRELAVLAARCIQNQGPLWSAPDRVRSRFTWYRRFQFGPLAPIGVALPAVRTITIEVPPLPYDRIPRTA